MVNVRLPFVRECIWQVQQRQRNAGLLAFMDRMNQNRFKLVIWGRVFPCRRSHRVFHEPTPNAQAPGAEEIRRQLKNILASTAFHGSWRCQQFLEHVVEKSLAGESAHLKERLVAIDVFGRSPQTDLGEDAIVRVGAREVRKRLAQYYVTPGASQRRFGLSCHLAPTFPNSGTENRPQRPRRLHQFPPQSSQFAIHPGGDRGMGYRNCALAAVATLTVVALRSLQPGPNASEFSKFWQPVLKSPEPLLNLS